MDENAAREAFETALCEYRPEFESFFLSRLVGLEFTYIDETCRVRFPVRDFMFNPQGSLHGGVIAFVLDAAMGHLLKHSLGVPGATLEIKVQYLAPVRGPYARCEARFLRKGQSVCYLEARLFDAGKVLAAAATSTWRVSKPKEQPARRQPISVHSERQRK
ncbi:MAG: PaaI family thioesterase [Hyphomicrobiaceae bacterium]|nr:MAG: PaaI family thioesterase [Hyphomicrobiaceae bacterium]